MHPQPINRYGLPIPYPVRLTIVHGEALEVEQTDAPTDAQVDQLHRRYVEAVVRDFEEHKAAAGYPEQRLVVP